MNVCYWCGELVLPGLGGREHLVPKAMLQDALSVDLSDFIVSKKNSHKKCNNDIAAKYEHDFCQILFHSAFGDVNAEKHSQSKIRNLEYRPNYLLNQFRKIIVRTDSVAFILGDSEKKSFEQCIIKILKGLYFKHFSRYLDLSSEYKAKIIWSTINLERDSFQFENASRLSSLLGGVNFVGNVVFKFRFQKCRDSNSFFWEFCFYDRFPVYIYLINKDDGHLFHFNYLKTPL